MLCCFVSLLLHWCLLFVLVVILLGCTCVLARRCVCLWCGLILAGGCVYCAFWVGVVVFDCWWVLILCWFAFVRLLVGDGCCSTLLCGFDCVR